MTTDRIRSLAAQSKRDADRFVVPDEDRRDEVALSYLREGVGPAIAEYLAARTGGKVEYVSPSEFEALEGAMNRWLELYARCYGVELDGTFSIRTAASVLLETDNVRDVAQVLTTVPSRHEPANDATNN